MKPYLIFSLLLFAAFFEATTAQDDYDKAFEAFLIKSTASFPTWLKENGYVPDPLNGRGHFILQSENKRNETYYDITGEFSNRYYHGADKNIQALDVKSNLTHSTFTLNLVFGDGENDFVEGSYSLNGKVMDRFIVSGNGKFRAFNQQRLPFVIDYSCRLQANDQGYFEIISSVGRSFIPVFQNFTMDNLDWFGAAWVITPVVQTWYTGQFAFDDNPNMNLYWNRYLVQVFAATPIADIVGEQFTPSGAVPAKKLGEMPKYRRQLDFDIETKQWLQQISVSY